MSTVAFISKKQQDIDFPDGTTVNTTGIGECELRTATSRYAIDKLKADTDMLVLTKDTNELFSGITRNRFTKISDIISRSNKDSFPTVGLSDRIYISEEDHSLYLWNGSSYANVVNNNSWRDNFIVGSTIQNTFYLSHIPDGNIKFYIDGIRYFEANFIYNASDNTITWNPTTSSATYFGTDIMNSEVDIEYTYVKSV